MTRTKAQEFLPLRQWKKKQNNPFAAQQDIRNLLAIHHPWAPSQAGGFASWETTATVPSGWRPGRPLFVSFYQSDNYSGHFIEHAWMGAQVFIGHRFKQLLVNGQIVWDQDVADEEFSGSHEKWFTGEPCRSGHLDPYRVVDISKHVKDKITLTFRVFDKVASTTKLPGDAYKRFSWSAFDPAVAIKNFQTSVYFGDVALSLNDRPVRPRERVVSAKRTRVRASAIPRSGIPLELTATAPLPSLGYPVRCGVPLPKGSLKRGAAVALRDPTGAPLPVVITELSHWPDGTVRWILCEFVAQAKGRYRLVPGATSPRPRRAVRVAERKGATTLSNGSLTLTLGPNVGTGAWECISRDAGGLDVGALDFSVKLNRVGWRDHFTARRQRIVIERSDPLLAVVRVEGEMLDEKKQRFGSWRARIQIWAGLPYILLDWTLVNESEQAMAMLLDWSARLALPDLQGASVDFGPFEKGFDDDDLAMRGVGHKGTVEKVRAIPLHKDSELSVRQERADQGRIYRNTSWVATTQQAAGFVNVQHPSGGVAGAMRWFAEEFPKGMVVRPNLLALATLAENEDALAWSHDRPFVRMGRGEAKRQTFGLYLHDGKLSAAEAERFNACVQDAPRLFDRSWFISSGALETGPRRDAKKLRGWAKTVTPIIERTGIGAPRLGHREYWDTAWSNDYRGRTHQGLIQYVETADPRWLRYFDAACTHNRDVDIIHFCPEHPDWVGANHSFGEDHTSCGPMGNIGSNCDGMLDHYLMTGDPDSFQAARGLAERLLSCQVWSRCARETGWPLSQLVRWYDQTHDPRFLRKAKEFMTAIYAYVESRRGVFAEQHGAWNYRGITGFMTGYLAFGVIRYHQLTGDPKVLTLLGKLAFGLFAESRASKGRFRYSPFPENNFPHEGFRLANGLIGGLAGYLFFETGERQYADWAKECHDAVLEKSKDQQITMDMLPLAGWMLHAVVERKS